jgi:hypothetical protein
MAMACFRLVTFLPERPERSFPRFISCTLFSTLRLALAPYFRRDDVFFFAAMCTSGEVRCNSPTRQEG